MNVVNVTSEGLHPIQIQGLRKLTPSQRFARGLRFLRAAREFLAAGVRARHPQWTDEQIAAETTRLIHHVRE